MANIIISDKDTKLLKTIQLLDEKMTSPALQVTDFNGNKFYGLLLDRKPNYPTLKINDKYLHDLSVSLGTYSVTRNWRGSGSGGHKSSWETVQNIRNHGFIKGIKFDFRVDITGGNYDGIGFKAHIKNKNDQSKVVELSKNWGTGDNWTSGQSYSYTFTKKDLELLGGPNTEIIMSTMVDNNTGGSTVYTRNVFTLTTY